MKCWPALALAAVACGIAPAAAQETRTVPPSTVPAGEGLRKGDIETSLTFEWYKVKDVSGSTLVLNTSAGYLFTDHLEAGLALAYNRAPEFTGGNIGVFGHWNFLPGSVFTPFAGVRLVPTFFSDERDLYKNSWELTAGAKFYPHEHAGLLVAVYYGRSNLENALPGFGDTSSRYGARAGFLFKF